MFESIFQNTMARKGYKFFTNGPYNVNIIGVRSNDSMVNSFDDHLYLVYKNETGVWETKQYTVTTDPGLSTLRNPLNVKGTAILLPDQYRSAYRIDLHAGKYPALCQRTGEVCVYRDNDKDDDFDFDVMIDCGYFGINIHKAGVDSEVVDGWSAGCQVFKREREFEEFMRIIEKSANLYGNLFSYTLLLESDFSPIFKKEL